MKKGLFLVSLVFLCSSCASLLTGRRSNIQIQTNKDISLVIEGDTLETKANQPVFLNVVNDKTPLPVTLTDGFDNRILGIRAKKPITYWLNAIPTVYFTGFLVDEITGLKWQYPKKIFIDVDGSGNSYLPYYPMDESLLELKNKITFAPFSIVHGYHPAYEFGYERLHENNQATQVSLGIFRSWNNAYARNSKGFKASVERKFFLRNQQNSRVYWALALEYHHKKHDHNLDFIAVDAAGNTIFPVERFSMLTTIQKRFLSITPRIGVQSYLSPRLVSEVFFGIGLRSRHVKHLNVSPNARYEEDFDLFFFDTEYLSNRPTRNASLNFDLNFRIAWLF